MFSSLSRFIYQDNDFRNEPFRLSLYEDSKLDYPVVRHTLGWSTRKKHLDFLYNYVRELKPKIIFETGTFEGHGTFAMCAAAHANNNGAKVFTFDYDGDPIQDESGSVSQDEWLALKEIRANNLALIQERYPNCGLTFTDGDTRQVLPDVALQVGGWDFWYQDSMHYAEGIRQEWDIMAPYANAQSLVIFDDVSRRNGFSRWFKSTQTPRWKFKPCRDFGHKQCLAQRYA